MKVLIVDDSVILQERLTDMLFSLNPDIKITRSAAVSDALNVLNRQFFNLAIIDIKLTDGNGIEVLKHIKKHDLGITTIMFTNYPYKQYQTKCNALGADYFLVKSDDFEKLESIIRNYRKN